MEKTWLDRLILTISFAIACMVSLPLFIPIIHMVKKESFLIWESMDTFQLITRIDNPFFTYFLWDPAIFSTIAIYCCYLCIIVAAVILRESKPLASIFLWLCLATGFTFYVLLWGFGYQISANAVALVDFLPSLISLEKEYSINSIGIPLLVLTLFCILLVIVLIISLMKHKNHITSIEQKIDLKMIFGLSTLLFLPLGLLPPLSNGLLVTICHEVLSLESFPFVSFSIAIIILTSWILIVFRLFPLEELKLRVQEIFNAQRNYSLLAIGVPHLIFTCSLFIQFISDYSISAQKVRLPGIVTFYVIYTFIIFILLFIENEEIRKIHLKISKMFYTTRSKKLSNIIFPLLFILFILVPIRPFFNLMELDITPSELLSPSTFSSKNHSSNSLIYNNGTITTTIIPNFSFIMASIDQSHTVSSQLKKY